MEWSLGQETDRKIPAPHPRQCHQNSIWEQDQQKVEWKIFTRQLEGEEEDQISKCEETPLP